MSQPVDTLSLFCLLQGATEYIRQYSGWSVAFQMAFGLEREAPPQAQSAKVKAPVWRYRTFLTGEVVGGWEPGSGDKVGQKYIIFQIAPRPSQAAHP